MEIDSKGCGGVECEVMHVERVQIGNKVYEQNFCGMMITEVKNVLEKETKSGRICLERFSG